ncbi:hypothetical protein [Pyxidicoccus sp. MSG2]|uniref:hypothetical protein n=1 Tax=Pyxidicoccus sp. MSG2 TaxID=2996790 RepID=UPI00226E7D93|nr:hypothetical protein [Pyxidicoccus sp. MSG2]MCY1017767.1 hypothetical protein [Pyxidicoccus sp. MSG2]
MVRCIPADEPADFDAQVRRPGARWLRENPRHPGRPPALWRAFNAELAEAFEQRCAYTAMFLGAPGTADHFVSLEEDRGQTYEWSNLRYSAAWLNSRKQALKSSQLLDPFEVRQGWFELLLPSLQLQVSSLCPPKHRKRAEDTLRLLGLDHDERVVRYRRQWLREYEQGEISLRYLERKAPLVAQAVRRWEEETGRPWPTAKAARSKASKRGSAARTRRKTTR